MCSKYYDFIYFYLFICTCFQGDVEGDVKKYMDKVEKCMCWTRHGKTLPRFYYIAGDENEQRSLACAQRVANDELFLWGQSLYLVAMMLGE